MPTTSVLKKQKGELSPRDQGKKPSHGAHPVYFRRRLSAGFPSRLSLFLVENDHVGCVVTSISRPLKPGHREFSEAFAPSNLCSKLRTYLQAMGMYAGESMHSFRRGVLQTLAATGVGEAELRAMVQMMIALIISLTVKGEFRAMAALFLSITMKGAPTMQTYLDVDGHLPRVAQQALAAAARAGPACPVEVPCAMGAVVAVGASVPLSTFPALPYPAPLSKKALRALAARIARAARVVGMGREQGEDLL